MAEYLHRRPPTRDVLVCFFDAQRPAPLGTAPSYGAINRSKAGLPYKPKQLEGLLEDYSKERDFVRQLVNLLKFSDPFTRRPCPEANPGHPAAPKSPSRQLPAVSVRGRSHNGRE